MVEGGEMVLAEEASDVVILARGGVLRSGVSDMNEEESGVG